MLANTEIFSAGQEGDRCGPISSDCVWVSERPELSSGLHCRPEKLRKRQRELGI